LADWLLQNDVDEDDDNGDSNGLVTTAAAFRKRLKIELICERKLLPRIKNYSVPSFSPTPKYIFSS
jgi:hypothetical protein